MTILVSKILAGLAAVALLIGGLLAMTVQDLSLGSVSVGNEYQATSTASSDYLGGFVDSRLIKTGRGTLGSYVVTGAATGIINLYDATTTNADFRAASKATTTLLIATFPASLAAGVYTFDISFNDGLYLDLYTGVMPTTTITFRN